MQNRGKCPRLECYQCPSCQAVLAVTKMPDGSTILRCGHCFWDSRNNGLVGKGTVDMTNNCSNNEATQKSRDQALLLTALSAIKGKIGNQARVRELEKRLESRSNPSPRSTILLQLAKLRKTS